jgi:hypothetical protein
MAELAHTKQALTDEDYRNFAQLFTREIPPSFRAHYMSFNGGHPAEEDVEAGRWGLPVHGFNPINYGMLPIEQLIEDMGAIEPEDDKFGSWVHMTRVVTRCFSHYAIATMATCIYTPQMAATSRA